VESLHTRTRGKLLAISAPSSFLRLVSGSPSPPASTSMQTAGSPTATTC